MMEAVYNAWLSAGLNNAGSLHTVQIKRKYGVVPKVEVRQDIMWKNMCF